MPLAVEGHRWGSATQRDLRAAEDLVTQPGNQGVLNWPACSGNPAETLRAGDVLASTLSGGGSGWFLLDEVGKQLAFLPADWAQQDAMSRSW